MAVLLNDSLTEFGCFHSTILCFKFKFSRVKVCVVVGYGSTEGDGEEREKF